MESARDFGWECNRPFRLKRRTGRLLRGSGDGEKERRNNGDLSTLEIAKCWERVVGDAQCWGT